MSTTCSNAALLANSVTEWVYKPRPYCTLEPVPAVGSAHHKSRAGTKTQQQWSDSPSCHGGRDFTRLWAAPDRIDPDTLAENRFDNNFSWNDSE